MLYTNMYTGNSQRMNDLLSLKQSKMQAWKSSTLANC